MTTISLPLIVMIWVNIFGQMPRQAQGGHIINAHYAKHGEFPFQVSIHKLSDNDTRHVCGGSIVDKYHVLTTSNCLNGKDIDQHFIVAGIHDLSATTAPNRVVLNIEKAYLHEQFDEMFFSNDIAVLRVTPGFPTKSPFVRPISLHHKTPSKGDPECTVMGWGVNSMIPNLLKKEDHGLLHTDTMPHFDWNRCRDAYEIHQKGFLKPGMICMGRDTPWKNYCPSDSGGPLICDGKLTGMFSWSHVHLPEVFTDVVYYQEWITKIITRSYIESGMLRGTTQRPSMTSPMTITPF